MLILQCNVINVLKTNRFIKSLVGLGDIICGLHILKCNLHLNALLESVLSMDEYLPRY
jgi:hypothetical protein